MSKAEKSVVLLIAIVVSIVAMVCVTMNNSEKGCNKAGGVMIDFMCYEAASLHVLPVQ